MDQIAPTTANPTNRLGSISASGIAIYLTAFAEGLSVMVVEIAGAPRIGPLFGASLQVWTAQITATLLFLALGYGLGGIIARRSRTWNIPGLFGLAGFWLALYPLFHTPLLGAVSARLSIPLGSFLCAAGLFGIPLTLLGAVSPVLIDRLHLYRPGAGSAAGRLFFTNTIGGLAGGWLTALVLIPYSSLRLSLLSLGLFLIVIALLWALAGRSTVTAVVMLLLLLPAVAIRLFHQPTRDLTDQYGTTFQILYTRQSDVGLLQVLQFPDKRIELIDGADQGEMDLNTLRSSHEYILKLHLLGYAYQPEARTALVLGIGPGLLCKELALRGLDVTGVEIDPRIAQLSMDYFSLPPNVHTVVTDGRAFIRNDKRKYDLIYLDTFAAELTPWHLLTIEAFQELRDHLNPGGVLVIDSPGLGKQAFPGLDRVEAELLRVLPNVMVYADTDNQGDPDRLINATLVAGEQLSPKMALPPNLPRPDLFKQVMATARPARPGNLLNTDDHSDLDIVEAPLRIQWRRRILEWLRPSILWD